MTRSWNERGAAFKSHYYRARTPRAAQLHAAASAGKPGDDTRSTAYLKPYSAFEEVITP